MKEEVEMEVFRSGDYGPKGAYSETDLQQMADDYQPRLLEAPLTFDHAQSGPAYGWVSRLRREGDRLVAVLKGVPEAVRDLVRAGAYKRRSVELFQKLPQTGRPYLRAVSLLGAATPEVKGLRDICFAAGTDNSTVQFESQECFAHPSSGATDEDAGSNFREQLESLQQQVRDAQFTLLFSQLRTDGYCLAERDAQAIRQLFASMDADASVVQFDDGTRQTAMEWLSEFLRQAVLRLPAGSVASSTVSASPVPASSQTFSERTDPQSLALHQRALSLQLDSPGLTYRDALGLASRQR